MTVGRVGFKIITARVPIRFVLIVRPLAVRPGAVVFLGHRWRRLGFRNRVHAAGHDDAVARIHGIATAAAANLDERQGSVRPPLSYRFGSNAISGGEGVRINKERGGFR